MCSKLADITQDPNQACDLLGFAVNPRQKLDEDFLAAIHSNRSLSPEAIAGNAPCHDLRSSFSLYGRSPVKQRDARGAGGLLAWGVLWLVALV